MSKLIIFAITVLLVGAIILLFDLPRLIKEYVEFRKTKAIEDAAFEDDETTPKKSLKKAVGYYQGKKEFVLVREAMDAKTILDETRRSGEYKKTITISMVLACTGAVLGLFVLKNIIAIPILAFAGFVIPLWRLKFYQSKYKKYLRLHLESATSLITASYIRRNNIIEAVAENLPNISSLIRPCFAEFVAEYKINPNMRSCIMNLQSKIKDDIFEEWCDCLIKAYENSEVKENLIPIYEKYSTVRIVQDELDSETAASILEYVIMLGLMLFVYPLIYVLNKDWFASFATVPGKFAVAVTLIVALFAVRKLIVLTTPVQFER